MKGLVRDLEKKGGERSNLVDDGDGSDQPMLGDVTIATHRIAITRHAPTGHD